MNGQRSEVKIPQQRRRKRRAQRFPLTVNCHRVTVLVRLMKTLDGVLDISVALSQVKMCTPRFRELHSCVKCFSGKKEDDFQLWLEDYEEASNDYQWKDNDQARWLSWFIERPTKVTWQRILKSAEKNSWEQIVTIIIIP